MNIFAASWFFPPSTSSEGIVTYKLLKNSKHHYDVFSSVSTQWGYKSETELRAENITSYTTQTDDIEQWVEECVEEFERLYPTQKYECIMTRSMPPESILVGQKIKQAHPEVKWIASFNDPIANNPYELRAYIDECLTLRDSEKDALKAALRGTDEKLLRPWEDRPEESIRLLCQLKRWEDIALKHADLILCPTGEQIRYMLGGQTWTPKLRVLPHSFDPSFYGQAQKKDTDKIVFSFIGYSDTLLRSVEPFVKAVRLLRENGSPYLDRLQIRFIGNHPRFIQDMVLDYYLEDVIQFQDGVDYYRSLELMQESDWLLHVDAFFPMLPPGGSIFFAGKLADYMGAGKPIFALTGKNSPADIMVEKTGGISVLQWEVAEIASRLEDILSGKITIQPSAEYVSHYRADRVAAKFDGYVEQLCGTAPWQPRGAWPQVEASHAQKLMTVCVPSYNVERYLERCVKTLIDHEYAADMEVLIVDDGSKDRTAEIGKAFEQHYPGIVRLIQKENGGHGSTINRAIQEAKGLYFKVVDGDDWVDSKQLGKLVGMIKSGEIDTDIISASYHQVNMETAWQIPWEQEVEVEYLKPYQFDEIDLEKTYFTLHSSWFKLSILKEMATPLQEHTFYVDVELILFPVPYLKTVTFVDAFIYKYCVGNTEQSVHIPTMVKRYDQHERVMMRVIRYKNEHDDMPAAQWTYYDAILKRHLFTQYALFMVYNPDKKEAYAIGKRFDRFLRKEDPALARWAGRHIPMLRTARLCGFHYTVMRFTPGSLARAAKTRAKNWLKSSRLLRVMARNRFTAKLGRTKFFTEGRGKALKERVKNVISN